MSKSDEVVTVMDDEPGRQNGPEFMEDGVEVPFERLSAGTLKNLISEFVTREWQEFGDSAASHEEMISQVHQQLEEKRAKVVFDLRSESCNIIVNDKRGR